MCPARKPNLKKRTRRTVKDPEDDSKSASAPKKKRIRYMRPVSYPRVSATERKRVAVMAGQSPEQRLKILTAEIHDIEVEIEKQAAKFETVRKEMLTGIVSHDGVSAKQVTEQLMKLMVKLQDERAEVIKKADRAVSDQQQAVLVSGPTKIGCPGGCKPDDLKVDSVLCVDVCTKCNTLYDRRLDNKFGNMSYADVHSGENISGGGGYKPPNHHAEIIAQFQGKRRVAAPQVIVDKIGVMCDRYKIAKHKITPDICRICLKLMQQEQATLQKFCKRSVPVKVKKYTDYYKHCPEISFRLSGIPPPYMTPTQERRVLALFPFVVAGYKSSPRYMTQKKNTKNRKTRLEPNNMNNYYVLFKEIQLLGYDEFLPYLPLPKSISNIDDNDENGWRHCCALYNWAYVSTR